MDFGDWIAMKKILIGGVIVLIATFAFAGSEVMYHVGQAVDWVRSEVEDSVPIEARLDEAEELIADLGPEIQSCRKQVASEEYDLKELERSIGGLRNSLERDERNLKARAEMIRSGHTVVSVAGRAYSERDLRHRVRLALERVKQKRALLTSKSRQYEVQTQALAAARRKLDATIAKKQNLELMVEQLRAQLLETQAMRAQAERFEFDDSKLTEIESILYKAKKDIAVTQKLLEEYQPADLEFEEVPEVQEVDIATEIDRYFGKQGATEVTPKELTPVVGG